MSLAFPVFRPPTEKPSFSQTGGKKKHSSLSPSLSSTQQCLLLDLTGVGVGKNEWGWNEPDPTPKPPGRDTVTGNGDGQGERGEATADFQQNFLFIFGRLVDGVFTKVKRRKELGQLAAATVERREEGFRNIKEIPPSPSGNSCCGGVGGAWDNGQRGGTVLQQRCGGKKWGIL